MIGRRSKWSHFPDAVRRKLVLDIAGPAAPPLPLLTSFHAPEEAYDCLIGERIWRRMMGEWS